jgi:hypothetical protein
MSFEADDPLARWERSLEKREKRLQAPQQVTGRPGAVVRCELAGALDHTGILIGDDTIIELDGSGIIQMVSYRDFLMASAFRTGDEITVASDDESLTVLADMAVATRAIDLIGKSREYHFLLDNCHQFSSGCITGDFENDDKLFSLLELTISEHLNGKRAIVWWPLEN